MATKYGKKAHDKVHAEMHEMKKGTLRSGSGKKVTSRKQAIAIGLSEARGEGGKVPKKAASRSSSKKSSGSKKSASKTTGSRKPASKKTSSSKKSGSSKKLSSRKSKK